MVCRHFKYVNWSVGHAHNAKTNTLSMDMNSRLTLMIHYQSVNQIIVWFAKLLSKIDGRRVQILTKICQHLKLIVPTLATES